MLLVSPAVHAVTRSAQFVIGGFPACVDVRERKPFPCGAEGFSEVAPTQLRSTRAPKGISFPTSVAAIMENQKSLQELMKLRAFLEGMDECINDEEHYQILMRHIAATDALIAQQLAVRTVEITAAPQAARLLRQNGMTSGEARPHLAGVLMRETVT